MLRKFLYSLVLLVVLPFTAGASHITGGEMYYTFTGMHNGEYQYAVTLRLLQRCGSNRQFPNPTWISIFNKTNGVRVTDFTVNISDQNTISLTDPDPCITNPPQVCYDVAFYHFNISLPSSAAGYVISSQVNYRIDGIDNLSAGSSNVGATYTAEIPGTSAAANGPENHSATFTGSDLVVICAENDFAYSFAANDLDGDELRYSFCEAYGSTSAGGSATPTGPPPYPSVPYNEPAFSSTSPLGGLVQVNPTTGLVTGIAPYQGTFVITVCVEEIRDGVVIARQRKDVQIQVADCNIAAASLLPEYLLCKNSQTISLANQSNSPLIVSTDWEFYDAANVNIFSFNGPLVTYTFPTIGVYTVKLVINRGQPCTDSTTSTIRVFPGFVPNFNSTGICLSKPTSFFDATTSIHGTPNSWRWDFGEPSSVTDVSSIQHPVYTYPSIGVKNVRLIASDTRGCRDTIYKDVFIIDKPPISLAFKDTLICINDNVTLQASGPGVFSWSPPVNIINPNSPSPTVSPTTTTTYYVTLDENGCINRDSVRVRVVNFVTLQPMADTIICRGDTIQLRVQSDGLQYAWAPASQIIDPTVQNPFVVTNNAQTSYSVTARIGGCADTKNILVTTVAYPVVDAGEDFTICYNTAAQLRGITDGTSWSWSPPNRLNNAAALNPVGYPPRTTEYVLTAYNLLSGCPKPSRDTILVTVTPKMNVSAGSDTAVIAGQPLQLNATGAIAYTWSPPGVLSATDIPNPIAVFTISSEDTRYKVVGFSEEGCRDSAYINIKVFKTPPAVFVPTAFTPNNDGRNDVLRPIAVGMSFIEYFNVYNRWGQLVFSTRVNGYGWDGRINGQVQGTNTYVWVVKAVDYTGTPYFKKGVVTLIK